MILLISYPDPDAAIRAHANFIKHYLSDADPNCMVLLENKKWATAKVIDRLLMIVLEADSRPLAESLLKRVE